MALKKYNGSCHCGAVRFEADIDLAEGTNRCNCSLCTKSRSWFVLLPAERVRSISGADLQTQYQWTPPGKPGSFLHFQFCRICGVRTYGYADPEQGGNFAFVSVASLDDVGAEELAAAPIRTVDGRNDRFDRAPTDGRPL